MEQRLSDMLKQGEGISIEFKRCGSLPEKDTFETICAFANRQGGHTILGIDDEGTIEGISENAVKDIERNIVNVTNNPNSFNTAPSLEFFHDEVDGKHVIDVWVPMGPSVYRYKGIVYDRIADVDVKLTGDEQISSLYIRKQNIYTERRTYPYVTKDDLDLSILDKARSMISANNPGHPWLNLSDDDLLKAARLYTRDFSTGKEGFNLACIMLLGKDETIGNVCPVYRTDAILRRKNIDRYDDRLIVSTNLIDSYYQLSDFCKRWLPDVFTIDNEQRIGARDIIIRELVVNTLIHREYSSPFISQLIITSEGLRTKNASRCLYSGRISLDNLAPTPKNPIVADFFTQIGLAEELGSGTRNLFKCSRLYTGKDPILDDGDFFNAFVPVPEVVENNNDKILSSSNQKMTLEEIVLDLLSEQDSITSKEIAEVTNGNQRTIRRHLVSMAKDGTLVMERKGRSTAYRLPDAD